MIRSWAETYINAPHVQSAVLHDRWRLRLVGDGIDMFIGILVFLLERVCILGMDVASEWNLCLHTNTDIFLLCTSLVP